MPSPDEFLGRSLSNAKQPQDHTLPLVAYYASCDENASNIKNRAKIELACAGGCSFCCHQRVSVVAHEVFVIANFVERKFTQSEKLLLLDRLRNHVEQIRTLTYEERGRMNITCPFLVNGRCSVYPVRPFVCRAAHSLNVAGCQRNYDQKENGIKPISVSGLLDDAWEEMGGRGDNCYRKAGYDMTEYDLPVACLKALTNPVHNKRWRQRKRAMLDA